MAKKDDSPTPAEINQTMLDRPNVPVEMPDGKVYRAETKDSGEGKFAVLTVFPYHGTAVTLEYTWRSITTIVQKGLTAKY